MPGQSTAPLAYGSALGLSLFCGAAPSASPSQQCRRPPVLLNAFLDVVDEVVLDVLPVGQQSLPLAVLVSSEGVAGLVEEGLVLALEMIRSQGQLKHPNSH
jgi:hypothetical protein